MSLNLYESFLGFGDDRDRGESYEESVFLFVWKAATVYLFGGAELGGNQADRDVDAALYLLMLLQIAHSEGCHVEFYDVCFDAVIFPK